MLITAEQVLAQMREQRRTFKSNDGSGYSTHEIQELTATDFSAMIHKQSKKSAQVSVMSPSSPKNATSANLNVKDAQKLSSKPKLSAKKETSSFQSDSENFSSNAGGTSSHSKKAENK